MPNLYIIDASGYLYRSYFAIRNITNQKGQSTNALFGFIRSVQKLFKDFSCEHIVAVFDGPHNVKPREAIYQPYKAHRAKMPPDLLYQIEWARNWCDLAGIANLAVPEVEADDTMGSIALWAKHQGYTTYLCTSDKDLCQLVDETIFILNTFKENLVMGSKEVEEAFGVRPDQIIDYLSIIGDSSDNVPGIAGIGPKGATKLLQEFGTLEKILENTDRISSKKVREAVEEGKDLAKVSHQLITLHTNVPFPKDASFFHKRGEHLDDLKAFYKEMDFNSLIKEIDQAAPKEAEKVTYHLVNDEASFKALLKVLEKSDEICFDTETTSELPLKAELVGISFAIEPGEAWYVPMNGRLAPSKILGSLKRVFEDPQKGFYGHNVKYDLHVLRNYGIEVKKLSFDTILASYILNAHERRHNLDHLTLTCFDKVKIPIQDLIGKGKKQISMRDVPIEKIAEYSCEDAECTVRLKKRFEVELKERHLEKILFDLELPLVPVLAQMERHGIFLDTAVLEKLLIRVTSLLKGLTEDIYQMAGETFNLNSPKQLSQILFDKMGIKPPRKTETGFSTDADVLESLKWDYPIAQKLLDYRTLEKLRSTYLEKLPLDIHQRDGRIHCTFNQTVAATGRLSCQDPNLQNIPVRTEIGREIREAIRPEKSGWSLLSADYSQIELRILAHLSQDESLIDAFHHKQDIHARTAADILNIPLNQVNKEERSAAKAVNFGIIYGQSDYGLAQELGISKKEASQFIDNYFKRYPKVKTFVEHCKEEARRSGRATTLTGRERLIAEIHSKNTQIRLMAERLAVNTPLQGTAADLIKIAMLHIDAKLSERKTRGFMILQIHDELIFEIPDEEISLFKELVPKYMQSALTLSVPLVVDVQVGKNWKEC
jgi:DNA polymerase-1